MLNSIKLIITELIINNSYYISIELKISFGNFIMSVEY